jgi:hypothetical protein
MQFENVKDTPSRKQQLFLRAAQSQSNAPSSPSGPGTSSLPFHDLPLPRTPQSSRYGRIIGGSTGDGLEDRFIPNRCKLDDELSHFLLTGNESTPTTPVKKTTPSHQRLKQELSQMTPKDGKRILDCRKSLTPAFDRASSSSSLFSVGTTLI